MMEKRPSDFSVVSKGYCFLCLDKISPFVDISSSSVTSFQDISRYLKIDMRKVFIQGGPVPPHLLAKVQRARLKVELCVECTFMTENISKHCRQLEKLKMEIETGLESIHVKMTNADKAGRAEHFQMVAGSEEDSGMGGLLDILGVLRQETVQKCSRKISKVSPRLKVQRLTAAKIQRKAFRTYQNKADTIPARTLDAGFHHKSTKVEEPVNEDWTLEDADNQSETPIADDDAAYTTPRTSVEDNSEPREGRVASENVIRIREVVETGDDAQRKWIMNPETGKYKCQLCSAEYGSRSGFSNHYDAVHRKLKFKCKICGKEFKQGSSYKVHHQSVHLGVRFQCKVCKKIFTQKNNLMFHQRKGGCGIGMG